MLADFADCNIEIANRLKKNRSEFSSFTQFAALNQSRDITYARMSRIFTHILLHMTAEDYKHAKQLGYVSYLRPLGFKKSSSGVLSEIKKHTDIPLIGKLANARQTLSDDAIGFLKKIFLRLISTNRYLHKKTEQSHEMNTPVKLFCCNDSQIVLITSVTSCLNCLDTRSAVSCTSL